MNYILLIDEYIPLDSNNVAANDIGQVTQRNYTESYEIKEQYDKNYKELINKVVTLWRQSKT